MKTLLFLAALGVLACEATASIVTAQDLVGHAYCSGIEPFSKYGGFKRTHLYSGGAGTEEFYTDSGSYRFAGPVKWFFDQAGQKFKTDGGSPVLPAHPMQQVRISPDKNYLVVGNGNIWHLCDNDAAISPTSAALSAGAVLEPNLGLKKLSGDSPLLRNTYWCSATIDGSFARRHFGSDGHLEVTHYTTQNIQQSIDAAQWSISNPGVINIAEGGNTYQYHIFISADSSVLYYMGQRHVRCDNGPVQQSPNLSLTPPPTKRTVPMPSK